MTSPVSAAADLFGLVAGSGSVLLAMLILRNPLAPNWLRTEAVGQAVSLAMTAGIFIAVVDAVAALGAAGISSGFIIIIVGGVLTASTSVLWKVFDIGDRPARAEAGLSPFSRRQPAAQTAAAALDAVATGS